MVIQQMIQRLHEVNIPQNHTTRELDNGYKGLG